MAIRYECTRQRRERLSCPRLPPPLSILLDLSLLFLMFAKTYTSLQEIADTLLNLSICLRNFAYFCAFLKKQLICRFKFKFSLTRKQKCQKYSQLVSTGNLFSVTEPLFWFPSIAHYVTQLRRNPCGLSFKSVHRPSRILSLATAVHLSCPTVPRAT